MSPTGYTAPVADGKVTDFATFALACARAFGALAPMRDASPDAPVPDRFEPSDHYARELAKARARLEQLGRMSPELAAHNAEEAYQRALGDHTRYLAGQMETRRRYQAMLDRVHAWTPPSKDHEELKKFMVDQLAESLRFDCEWRPEAPRRLSGREWLEQEIERSERDVKYHATEHGEEIARTARRNTWIAQLRQSLDATESAA